MRFWQGIVVAFMTAGLVRNERYHDVVWLHLLADFACVSLSGGMWRLADWVLEKWHDDVD
jgi:hypothetical protein